MEILYSDNHIIVVNKPPGLATEATEGESVESHIKEWVKEHYKKSGAVFVRAVHRLDKPVSGVLLLAKTSKALERLHASFRGKQVEKRYVALVEGVVEQEEGSMEDYLVHDFFRASVVGSEHPKAKRALLSYRVRRKNYENSLVEIDLYTGRYHQIRVQFSSRGHPIMNDGKYGARFIKDGGNIALHQERLVFPHPISKKELVFFSSSDDLLETFSKKPV